MRVTKNVAVVILIWWANGSVTRAQTTPASADQHSQQTIVEQLTDKPKPDGGGLGTVQYEPSEKEKPFFKKLAPDEITAGGLTGEYSISTRNNKYVGWFGIVQAVEEDKENNATRLVVEHKYFDGLTDSHIQSLSFDGSGDFEAILRGTGHKIARLTLVRIYGTAKALSEPSRIIVNAEYIRNWTWGTFTFMFASPEQAGNAKWRKLNTVDLDDIYDPYPDDAYYESRLGKR